MSRGELVLYAENRDGVLWIHSPDPARDALRFQTLNNPYPAVQSPAQRSS